MTAAAREAKLPVKLRLGGMKRVVGGMVSMSDVRVFLKSLVRNDEGVTAVEYGLIAGLISVTLIVVLTALSGDLSNVFNTISNAL